MILTEINTFIQKHYILNKFLIDLCEDKVESIEDIFLDVFFYVDFQKEIIPDSEIEDHLDKKIFEDVDRENDTTLETLQICCSVKTAGDDKYRVIIKNATDQPLNFEFTNA